MTKQFFKKTKMSHKVFKESANDSLHGTNKMPKILRNMTRMNYILRLYFIVVCAHKKCFA